MMSFTAAAVLIAVISLTQAALDRDQNLEILRKCKKETGAPEDVVEVFDKQKLPESPQGKCMLACVLREKGLMKGDKVDGKAISEFFDKTYADDPERLEELAQAVGICSTTDVKGLNKCEVAYAYLKCGKKHNFRL